MVESFGINISLKHRNKEDLDKYINLTKELQCSWIRIEFDYYDFKKNYDLSGFDHLIKTATENNIKILGVLTGVVPGTLPNIITPAIKYGNPLDEIDKYKEFVKTLAIRYKKNINHWQIWNEENIRRFWTRKVDPKEYFKLFIETVPILKEINYDNKVIPGSISGDDINFLFFGFEVNFLEQLIDFGINDFVEIYAFNPYHITNYIGLVSPKELKERFIHRINNFYDKYSKYNKEIWITELGIPNYTIFHVKRKDFDVANNYVEILDYTIKKGIKTFIWVLTDFNDNFYSYFNPEPHFGLVDYNLKEKLTYTKIKDYMIAINKN